MLTARNQRAVFSAFVARTTGDRGPGAGGRRGAGRRRDPWSRMPSGVRDPAIQWPGCRHLAVTCRYSAWLTALFALVYGGADLIARQHSHRAALYVPLDFVIPFVPWMTVIYSSVFAMTALVPFMLRRRSEVKSLARVVALEIVICGGFFVAIPMADRPAPAELGTFAGLFYLADRINLDYNQFPSLHAAFGFTFASVLGARCAWWGRVAFAVWGLAIAASALLTYQHGILDIAGAGVLTASLLMNERRGRPAAEATADRSFEFEKDLTSCVTVKNAPPQRTQSSPR